MPNFFTEDDFIREAQIRGKLPWQINWDALSEKFPDWDIGKIQTSLVPKTTMAPEPYGPPEPSPTIGERVGGITRKIGKAVAPATTKEWWTKEPGFREWLYNLARSTPPTVAGFVQGLEPFDPMAPSQQHAQATAELEKERALREVMSVGPEPAGGIKESRAWEAAEQIPFLGRIPQAIRDPKGTLYDWPAPVVFEAAMLAAPFLRGKGRMGRAKPTETRPLDLELAPKVTPEPLFEAAIKRPEFKDWVEQKGRKWPVKQSHPDYLKLIEEYRKEYPSAPKGEIIPTKKPIEGDLVEMHAGIPLGKITPEFIKKGAEHIFYQARNRVKHPLAKQTVEEIQSAWAEQARLRGSLEEYGKQTKLWKIGDKDAELITQHRINPSKIELPDNLRPINDAIDGIFQNTFEKLREAKVQVRMPDKTWRPIGQAKNYVPRKLKPQISREIFDDIVQARRKAKGRAKETGEMEDNVFAEIVDAMYRRNKFNPRLRETIGYFLKSKQAKTPGEAVALMDEFTFNDLFSPFGNIERPRMLKFPMNFYENNIKNIMAAYIAGYAKRLPEIKKWGQDARVITNRLSQITRGGDPAESQRLSGIVARFTGKVEKLQDVHPALKKAIEAYTGAEVTTKIGLGWASVPQLTQPTISFIPLTRLRDWVPAGLRMLSSAERSWARQTGAPGFKQLKSMTGLEPRTTPGRVAHKAAEISTKATGFWQLNKVLQYWSAGAGKSWLKHLHKTANSKIKFRREWARRNLKDWGVDPNKPLTENQLKESSYRFAMDTQLQRNIAKEPMWMNNPRWRWLGLFKRFGYRQFNLVKDQMWREAKHGNPLPMLKLVAGGTLGGEFVIWAKNRIREFMTGRPHYRDEDTIWHRAINDLAAVGTLGWITDMGRFEESTPVRMIQDLKRTAEFQISPVIVSDIKKTSGVADRFLTDLEKRGYEGAVRRAIPHVVGLVGGVLASKLKERLKTPQQYKDVMTMLKRETRQRAFYHADKGNWERCFDIITKWNEYQDPDFWIDYPKIKDIQDYRKHKTEMELNP